MNGIEAALVWLLEVVSKKKIGDLLITGQKRREQVLQRALEDSQNQRDEMVGTERLLTGVLVQRDDLQREVFALRIRNAELEAKNIELGDLRQDI